MKNPLDEQLDRLFRAATPGGAGGDFLPPYGLETRVMAAWRSAGDPGMWSTGLLVRGLLLASVIMGLSFWPLLSQKANPTTDYLQLADSSLPADESP